MTLLVDKLCLNIIFFLKKNSIKEIVYLDPANKIQRFLFSLLGFLALRQENFLFIWVMRRNHVKTIFILRVSC